MSIQKTVSFSGYRPAKLPGGGDENAAGIATLKSDLHEAIVEVISHGYDTFLVGMADGFDTFAGEAVVDIKKQYPHIKLICVLPFKEAENRMSKHLITHADDVVCLSDKFHAGAYHTRNRYLVENSALLICYYDGQDGGTNYTVEYAIRSGKKIHNLYDMAQSEALTKFHAKHFALELMQKKTGGGDDRLTATLFNSTLEINPHQIEAALFAFKSPLSKGVLLADEVGLGKTIEAGLVMCQLYAEQKTRQLVICPASLRKQWALELLEKFNMPSFILESRTHAEFEKLTEPPFFSSDDVVITSYNYAARIADKLRLVNWDLVVIDEAHKLRNSYRTSNKTGQGIKFATSDSKKILLTATPLQNNLTELYGITSVIDEHIFGDVKSFRELYTTGENFSELKERLSHFCMRTLRRDVTEYIKYTKRIGLQKRFDASLPEQKLYDGISAFLQGENTYAVPYRQKMITTLIIRKVLASSSWAVCQTLEVIRERLLKIKDGIINQDAPIDDLFDEDEYEVYLETADEIDEDEMTVLAPSLDIAQLNYEIDKLNEFIKLAKLIKTDSKSISLLEALTIGFEETARLGGNKKGLIFTESRRTQDYLKKFLETNGYKGKIVLFNGQNGGKDATDIYNKWYAENKFSNRVSGSKTADKRNALIEYFRDTAEICIATEAAAEGVNLQFCSLVINYDLPWNPQRIEQRIGRCHRYGQKNDVVVINFINNKNYADVRVAELLEEKFKLFDGVFGSSDDVLGVIENGVDFEKRILAIYQECRTPQEIQSEFDALQKELEDKIKKTMKKARDMLFENFDTEVHERLKLNITEYLDRYTRLFWRLSKYILGDGAYFFDAYNCFMLKEQIPKCHLGRYNLISKTGSGSDGTIYRASHPLGKYVLSQALDIAAQQGKVTFDISNNKGYKLSVVENLKGKSGYLSLHKYTISWVEQEEHLLFCAFTDDGEQLKPDVCRKLFDCIGYESEMAIPGEWEQRLQTEAERYADGTLEQANERNLVYVKEEEERLHKWAEDMILSLEKELQNIKKQITETERLLRQSTSTAEHLELQTKLQELNKRKRNARARLEENEDEIYEKRKELIANIKKKMATNANLEHVFTIKWEVV